jgi:sigma-B regulation protein RsbU (phosphoserine phosphatase)
MRLAAGWSSGCRSSGRLGEGNGCGACDGGGANVRSTGIDPGTDPTASTMMNRVLDDLYEDLSYMGRFATLGIGSVDPVANTLALANCGHSPVIGSFGASPVRIVEANEPPVGVFPPPVSDATIIPFHEGDFVVMATDGFPEASNRSGELYGYDRMLNLIDTFRGESAERIAGELVLSEDRFSGGQVQTDDQALLVLKRTHA